MKTNLALATLLGLGACGGQSTVKTTQVEYDASGRVLRTIDPLGHTTSYVYDDANYGNLTALSEGDGSTILRSATSSGRPVIRSSASPRMT